MSFFTNLADKVIGRKKKNPQRNEKTQNFSLPRMLEELGVRTETTIGTYQEEENPDARTIQQYIAMQDNDGTVRAITRLFAMPIQSTPIKILPAEHDKGERDFIENVFMGAQYNGGMTTPLPFVIADMTRAIVEGFRLYEKVPWVIPNGKYKGYIGWRKLAPRDSFTVKLRSDERGGFLGAHQQAYFGFKLVDVNIPPEKCILFTFQKERHPFYGESILKTAYYHYDKKHKLYYLAHKKAEIDAVGVKILKLNKPLTEGEVTAAENAVDEIGANSRVTLPAGFELDIDRSPSGYDVLKLIEHHDSQIVLSTLTQAMQLATKSSYAYPYGSGYSSQTTFIDQMLSSVMKSMEDTLNEWAVAPLVDWNFGSGNYPKIKLMPLKDEVKENIMKLFTELVKKDPSIYVNSAFASKLANEVAKNLGIDVNADIDKAALRAFEAGKKKVFDKNAIPAVSTPEKIKETIKKKAVELKEDPYILDKIKIMGEDFALDEIKRLKI